MFYSFHRHHPTSCVFSRIMIYSHAKKMRAVRRHAAMRKKLLLYQTGYFGETQVFVTMIDPPLTRLCATHEHKQRQLRGGGGGGGGGHLTIFACDRKACNRSLRCLFLFVCDRYYCATIGLHHGPCHKVLAIKSSDNMSIKLVNKKGPCQPY